jgi:hypothetical protein
MKKFIYFLASTLAFVLFSCNNDLDQIDAGKEYKVAAPGPDYEYVVTCEGDCGTEADRCTDAQVLHQIWECNCDACYFVIELVGEGGLTEEVVKGEAAIALAKELYRGYEHGFVENLKSFLAENAISEESIVDIRRSIVRDGSFFGIRYEIKDNLDVIRSVTFISEGINGPTYEVSCSGGCDDHISTCRERWVLGNPPSAECTCEGDCKMTVTEGSGPGLSE